MTEIEQFRIYKATGVISLSDWSELIASHSALEPVPDQTGINPFTQARIVFPGAGKAYYVVNGKRTGNATLEDGAILTTGIPRSICDELARQFVANVAEDDRT